MSLEKPLAPNIGTHDRIIVGFAIRPKAGGDMAVWHLAFEKKDGTRWYRARYMDRDGQDVCEFDITGKTDEQVIAQADGFIKEMGSELPVVVAVYETNVTLKQWVAAVRASDALAVTNYANLLARVGQPLSHQAGRNSS